MKNKVVNLSLLILAFFLFNVGNSYAGALNNTGVLLKQIEKVSSCRKCVVPEINRYNESKVITVSDMPGYSKGISTKIRAEMFPDDGYAEQSSVTVYSLPARIYFPDNPNKDPLKISMFTVDIHSIVQNKVIGSKEVGVPYGGMNGKKSKYIVYGQPLLKKTKTVLTFKENSFLLESTVDISGMSDKDGKKYLKQFQNLITLLNQELSKMNNFHYAKWEKVEEKRIAKLRKALYKKSHTNIQDIETFAALVGFQLNAGSLLSENVKSDLGHWSYADPDAYRKQNVTVEAINYGKYYEMLYLVAHDKALEDSPQKLFDMRKKMNDKLKGNLPAGAKSVEAKDSGFNGITDVIVTYELGSGVKGKQITKNSGAFAKFTKKTFSKLKKIADKTK